jgi:hypothetical protein
MAAEHELAEQSTPGQPHPDPALAALGWHRCEHGIYVKDGVAGPADVAALKRYAAALPRPRWAPARRAEATQELEAGA